MTTIQINPRALVRASLVEMRRPLAWVQKFTRQEDGLGWPPASLFDSFEAAAKRVAGTLIRRRRIDL
jgi:hypothetical protein